jgi:hypothetical protein
MDVCQEDAGDVFVDRLHTDVPGPIDVKRMEPGVTEREAASVQQACKVQCSK